MAWTEINKLYGGTYDNMQPVFDLIAAHLDDMVIATYGSNQMTMYQQGEIAVFMASHRQRRQAARARHALPNSSTPKAARPAVPVTIHLVKGASDPDARLRLHGRRDLGRPRRPSSARPPTAMIPTNTDVPFSPWWRST